MPITINIPVASATGDVPVPSRIAVPIRGCTAAVLALSLLTAGCGGRSNGSALDSRSGSRSDSDNAAQICETLQGYVSSDPAAAGKVQGYSFAVFDESRILMTCAGGNQTLAAIRPIASASKLPSAAAIMTLVDSGQLRLDLPVSFYLFGSGVAWPLDKALITMRMLLAHTSGLPGLGTADLQAACLDEPIDITMQECVRQIAAAPLVSLPGLAFNYGAADYQVAGYIATRIAGQGWQEFFDARIGRPLGLDIYTYGAPERVSNPRVAGGAFSNVADYVRILQMILNGGQAGGTTVLSPRSIATLETNQIRGRNVRYSPVDSALYPGYSFGFFISDASLHPGSAGPEFSDPGLFGTTPWIDEDLGYGAVLLIDKDSATGLGMWNAVRPLIIAALQTPTP